MPPFDTYSLGQNRELIKQLRQSLVFQQYQQAFERTTGLPLTLRQAGSFQIPLHYSRSRNPFCQLMSETNGSCAACLQHQQRLEEKAIGQSATLECYAGLTESLVPLQLGAQVIGFLQTGQVLLRKPTSARFRKTTRHLISHGLETNLSAARETYFKTRVLSSKQYNAILSLLEIFAHHLTTLGQQHLVTEKAGDPPAITRAKRYIIEHHTDTLSLPLVAKRVNMSAFYFCKKFKEVTGFTFTYYVTTVRLEHAKELLLNQHKRVSEAAYEAGFQSLSQFNRVFRHNVGQAPSTFQQQLRHQLDRRTKPKPMIAHAA